MRRGPRPILAAFLAGLGLGLLLTAAAQAQVVDWTDRGGSLTDRLASALQQAGQAPDGTRSYTAFRMEALVPSDARPGGSGVVVIQRSGGWTMSGLGGLVQLSDPWDEGAPEEVVDLATMSMTRPDPEPTLVRRPVLTVLTAVSGPQGASWIDAFIRLPEGKMQLRGRTFHWLGEVTNSEVLSWLRAAVGVDTYREDFREDLVGIASIQPRDMGAPALLEGLLEDPSEDVRHRAIAYLGRRPEETTPILERVYREAGHESDRAEALEALADRQGEAARGRLIDAVRDTEGSEEVRRTALGYLARIPGREVDRVLEGLLIEGDPRMRRRVVSAWERREPERAVPLLERTARRDEDEDVQQEAVESLGDVEGDLSTAALRRLFDDHPSEQIRVDALEELVRRPGGTSVAWLEELANGDVSMEVRKEAVQALGRMEDPGARQALRRILSGGG